MGDHGIGVAGSLFTAVVDLDTFKSTRSKFSTNFRTFEVPEGTNERRGCITIIIHTASAAATPAARAASGPSDNLDVCVCVL